MKDFEVLLSNPELAKYIRFEITGSDLLELSATLISASKSSDSDRKETYLTNGDVCKLVNRDKRTLSSWHKKNILKHNQIGLYKKSDVDKLLEKK